MYVKTLTVKIDWLREIDGMTVEKAIAYLQTLNPSHTLDCYMEGDTHGCEIVSRLSYTVPMTNKEIFAQLEKHYLKEIAIYTAARDQHRADGRRSRMESCDRMLAQLNMKYEAAKLKYKE